MTELKIIKCDETEIDALYVHYSGQHTPQNCYLELDHSAGKISVGVDCEGGIPFRVFNGLATRWDLPAGLLPASANALMVELLPLLEKIQAGWSDYWDGDNRGRLDDDAAWLATDVSQADWRGWGIDDEDILWVEDADDWLCDNDDCFDSRLLAGEDIEKIVKDATTEYGSDLGRPCIIIDLDDWLENRLEELKESH